MDNNSNCGISNSGKTAINNSSTCNCTVTVDKFYLDGQGFPLISLAATTTTTTTTSPISSHSASSSSNNNNNNSNSSSSSNSNSSTSSSSSTALATQSENTVDWQAFYYCLDSESWVRVSDLKNTLSSLFLNIICYKMV